MTQYKYYLNKTGEDQLRKFLAENLKNYDPYDRDMFEAWKVDLIDSRQIYGNTIGYIEIQGYASTSGNPVVETFSDDCFDTEEVEEEDSLENDMHP